LGNCLLLRKNDLGERNYHGDGEAAHAGEKNHKDHCRDQIFPMRL